MAPLRKRMREPMELAKEGGNSMRAFRRSRLRLALAPLLLAVSEGL
jgi:hypothetical protein